MKRINDNVVTKEKEINGKTVTLKAYQKQFRNKELEKKIKPVNNGKLTETEYKPYKYSYEIDGKEKEFETKENLRKALQKL